MNSANPRNVRRWLGGAVAVAAAIATVIAPTPAARAQGAAAPAATSVPVSQQPLPANVLLFPAVVTGASGSVSAMTPAVKQTQEIVTEAVRKYLAKGGVGVVVYSSRLSSVQRAVNAGEGLKPEDATKGPGDDPRLAAKFADIVGAQEYVLVSVDNYSYDPKTRRATFNLSLTRSGADGVALGTYAEKAVGDAPEDVAPSKQEGSAVARAAEVAAEKSVIGVYPQAAAVINPPKMEKPKKKNRNKLSYIIPAAALGAFLIIPR